MLSHDLLAKTRHIFTLIHWEYRFLGETEKWAFAGELQKRRRNNILTNFGFKGNIFLGI